MDVQSSIDSQSQSLDAQEKQAQARQAALNQQRASVAQRQDAEMRPLEGALNADLSAPVPQRPQVEMPKPPQEVPVNPKEYEGLSYALLGIGLIAGSRSAKNWNAAGQVLNGAIKGYIDGKHDEANAAMQDYERKFKAAKDHEEQVNKEFDDVLNNRRLTISEQLERIRVLAAQHGREDVRIAAEQRSIDGVIRQIDAGRAQLAGVQQRSDAVTVKANAARQGSSEDIDRDAQAVAEGRLDPRMLSTKGGWREKVIGRALEINPDYDSKNYSADAAYQTSGMRAAGAAGAKTAIAAGAAQGGADILMEAAARVPRGEWRTLNKAILTGKNETNDPDVGAFNTALNTFINEYSRAVNPSGVATKSDKDHARELLAVSDSPAALSAKIGRMRQEMQRARQAPQDVARDLKAGRTSSTAPAVAQHPQDIQQLLDKYGH